MKHKRKLMKQQKVAVQKGEPRTEFTQDRSLGTVVVCAPGKKAVTRPTRDPLPLFGGAVFPLFETLSRRHRADVRPPAAIGRHAAHVAVGSSCGRHTGQADPRSSGDVTRRRAVCGAALPPPRRAPACSRPTVPTGARGRPMIASQQTPERLRTGVTSGGH